MSRTPLLNGLRIAGAVASIGGMALMFLTVVQSTSAQTASLWTPEALATVFVFSGLAVMTGFIVRALIPNPSATGTPGKKPAP